MTDSHNSDSNVAIYRVDPIIMSSSPDQLSDQKNKELASLFECPVCFDSAIPPILQCQSGHIVCSACRSKLTACPTCRGPLENIRNLALEKLALNVLFPCKYASCGCQIYLQFTKKKQHEEVCDYRPYLCPCPDSSCKWMGRLDEIMTHLIHTHKNITTLQGEDIVFLATDINLPGAVDWVMMQTCFGYSFMLVLEKQERLNDQRFYAIVRLIGTRKQAQQFAYRLELSSIRRRLTWDATPCSIHDSVQTAITNSDCLVLDASTAHIFAKNGNLGINVTIWPVNYSSGRRSEKIDSALGSAESMSEMMSIGNNHATTAATNTNESWPVRNGPPLPPSSHGETSCDLKHPKANHTNNVLASGDQALITSLPAATRMVDPEYMEYINCSPSNTNQVSPINLNTQPQTSPQVVRGTITLSENSLNQTSVTSPVTVNNVESSTSASQIQTSTISNTNINSMSNNESCENA